MLVKNEILEDGSKVMTLLVKITPRGALRMNAKGKYGPRVKPYIQWKKDVQWIWRAACIEQGLSPNLIFETGVIVGIDFGIPIPNPETKGISKEEKQRRLNLIGNPHQKKPDLDNMLKAFIDALYYGKEQDDCHIHTVGLMRKFWTDHKSGHILVTFSVE